MKVAKNLSEFQSGLSIKKYKVSTGEWVTNDLKGIGIGSKIWFKNINKIGTIISSNCENIGCCAWVDLNDKPNEPPVYGGRYTLMNLCFGNGYKVT